MTERQQQITEFITLYKARHGWLPSVREIADHLGVVVSVAHGHISRHPGLVKVESMVPAERWDVKEGWE